MRISDWSSDVCSSDLYPSLENLRALIFWPERTRKPEQSQPDEAHYKIHHHPLLDGEAVTISTRSQLAVATQRNRAIEPVSDKLDVHEDRRSTEVFLENSSGTIAQSS